MWLVGLGERGAHGRRLSEQLKQTGWVGVSAGGQLAEPPPTAAPLQGVWPSAGGAPEVGDGMLAGDAVCDAGRAAARALAAARSEARAAREAVAVMAAAATAARAAAAAGVTVPALRVSSTLNSPLHEGMRSVA